MFCTSEIELHLAGDLHARKAEEFRHEGGELDLLPKRRVLTANCTAASRGSGTLLACVREFCAKECAKEASGLRRRSIPDYSGLKEDQNVKKGKKNKRFHCKKAQCWKLHGKPNSNGSHSKGVAQAWYIEYCAYFYATSEILLFNTGSLKDIEVACIRLAND